MTDRNPMPLTVFTPESAIAAPSKMLRDMARDLRESRELAWRLAVRDINAQYRQTLLGFLWALLLPLAHTAIWVFLGASGLLQVGATGMPYPAYVLIGTMLWAIFSDAVNAPLQGAAASRDMLVKVNFAREAIIISGLYQVAFNAAIKFAILVAAVMLLGVHPDWRITLAPFGIAGLVAIGTALGLVFVPLGLLYNDIAKGLPLFLQFLMYLTPIVYPIPASGIVRDFLLLNPLVAPIEVSRQWLTGGSADMLLAFALVVGAALVFGLALWVVYRLAMPIVIERMSS